MHLMYVSKTLHYNPNMKPFSIRMFYSALCVTCAIYCPPTFLPKG